MEQSPVRSWKAEFARSTDAERYREILRRTSEEIKKKEREEERAEREQDSLDHLEAMVVMATEAELDHFSNSLDTYDTATYEALLENERILDLTNRERDAMLEKAFLLPDGRRVFESEDGVRVFDANGVELDPSVISADEIEDWRPKYEGYASLTEKRQSLLEERDQLIAYQDRLAEARQRVEDGDLTKQELEELKNSLEEQMPGRVRELLPEDQRPAIEPNEPEPEQCSEATWRAGVKLDLPTL